MHKPPIKSTISFHFLQFFSLTDRISLKDFIKTLFRREKKSLETLTFIFCSDDYLLEINRIHLKHDYFTDIITFDLSDPGHAVNAEIYISVDRVKENARIFDVSFKREMHRVLFHGVLHLCGYKDKSEKDALKMRKMEDKCLKLYFAK